MGGLRVTCRALPPHLPTPRRAGPVVPSENYMITDCKVFWGVGMSVGSVPPNTAVNCIRNVTFQNVRLLMHACARARVRFPPPPRPRCCTPAHSLYPRRRANALVPLSSARNRHLVAQTC
jgi:hypothetical protein